MNLIIVERLKSARLARGLTQKDLADYLGKTAAAISELERGKVQISARDLFSLSEILYKPIEYFFGVEYGSEEVHDLIAIVRKQPPEERRKLLAFTSLLVELQELDDSIKLEQEGDIDPDKIRQFYQAFLPLSKYLNLMVTELNDLHARLDEEVRLRGINLPHSSG